VKILELRPLSSGLTGKQSSGVSPVIIRTIVRSILYANMISILGVLFVMSFAIFFSSAFAAPSNQVLQKTTATVTSSPTCGPLTPGFNMYIHANGFKAMTPVYWELRHSIDGKIEGPSGTFETNKTGGFSEITYIEHLPSPGKYTLVLFDDTDNDAKMNPGEATASTQISIPCR
jgi:hypothetical protein